MAREEPCADVTQSVTDGTGISKDQRTMSCHFCRKSSGDGSNYLANLTDEASFYSCEAEEETFSFSLFVFV